MSFSPYAAADKDKLELIIRLAEARLEAQLTLGVAADQRAMTLASFLIAADAAVIAIWATTTSTNSATVPLVILIVGMAVAAGLAIWSAMPIAWEIVGNEPSAWRSDIPTNDSVHNGLAAMAEYYDDMLSENDRRLTIGANWVRASFVAMFVSVVAAAISAAII